MTYTITEQASYKVQRAGHDMGRAVQSSRFSTATQQEAVSITMKRRREAPRLCCGLSVLFFKLQQCSLTSDLTSSRSSNGGAQWCWLSAPTTYYTVKKFCRTGSCYKAFVTIFWAHWEVCSYCFLYSHAEFTIHFTILFYFILLSVTKYNINKK